MGTRCTIAVKVNKQIISIAAKLNGFPSWTGSMLYNYWNSQMRAEELVQYGDTRYVPSDIIAPEYYDYNVKEVAADIPFFSNFHDGRYHHEPSVPPRIHKAYSTVIKKEYYNNDADWFYYWNGKEWLLNEQRLARVLAQIRLGDIDEDATWPTGELASFNPW